MNNKINFNGNFIRPTVVKKINKDNKYIPHRVSLIQIDTTNQMDIKALRDTFKIWENDSSIPSFSDIIYEDAKQIHDKNYDNGFHKFFVLTNQKKHFYKLNYNDILAMSEISAYPHSKKINIDAIEVHPEHNYWSSKRNFKGIGSAFLDAIKKVFDGKEITLRSVPSAIDFYKKNGFHQITKDSHDLQYLEIK